MPPPNTSNKGKQYSTDDFEIGDVETYGTQNDSGFSHQQLVMNSMKKVLENGSREMKPGWFETKMDRSGNQTRTYIEDTRESFISSMESLMGIMECDLDEEATNEMKFIFDNLEKRKSELMLEEDTEWNSLNPIIKRNLMIAGKGFIKGSFNKEKRFYQIFLEEKVKQYREIFKSLTRLSKRINFYHEEVFETY